jgi:hypothetical protein
MATAPKPKTSPLLDALDADVPVEVDVFELLWQARARVHIPDTIVYKFGKLESWFFTASSSKHPKLPVIKRKNNYTVRGHGDVNETIRKAFCAHTTTEQDLVATWVSGDPGENAKVLHLTQSTLGQFLAHMPAKGHGVLQRWVAPFGGRSTQLRTDWSPHHFSLEMCTNWHSVHDSRRPLRERLATFDGGLRHVTIASVVNENLHARAEGICRGIASRFDAVHPDAKVWQMQMNFKPCADGHVRLMWCSKLVMEKTDGSGFSAASAVITDLETPLETPTSSATSSYYGGGPSARFRQPQARRWDGGNTPCDGSIFHSACGLCSHAGASRRAAHEPRDLAHPRPPSPSVSLRARARTHARMWTTPSARP